MNVTNNWKMKLLLILAIIIAIGLIPTGDTDNTNDANVPENNSVDETPTTPYSAEYIESIRSESVNEFYNGNDTSLTIRYDLDAADSALNSDELSDKQERRALENAATVLDETSSNESVDYVALYAYVETNEGEVVSTKIIVPNEDLSTDEIRQRADQYKHNDYLY